MKVSIVGLGWLGEPLAKLLLQHGYNIRGSTTSAFKASRLSGEGIPTQVLSFNPLPEGEHSQWVFESEVLVVNIPPGIRKHGVGHYLEQVRAIKECARIAGVPKIIFISTTSVYPSLNQTVSESDHLNHGDEGSPFLIEAENIFRRDKNLDLTVLRLGGLFGGLRIPGKYFANQTGISGHPPVNYIHRVDAIRLVHWILRKELWNETFNGVAPLHPPRREVYEQNAALWGFAQPKAYEDPPLSSWKKVSSIKILQTGFQFIYPDPLTFSYE